mmetsp:Transcript_29382/g.90792  ORF Transcript_29382/g.90792 Transcript_29382/m.90792 type:complete len:219 (-) Transcript_29382:283-939(-)
MRPASRRRRWGRRPLRPRLHRRPRRPAAATEMAPPPTCPRGSKTSCSCPSRGRATTRRSARRCSGTSTPTATATCPSRRSTRRPATCSRCPPSSTPSPYCCSRTNAPATARRRRHRQRRRDGRRTNSAPRTWSGASSASCCSSSARTTTCGPSSTTSPPPTPPRRREAQLQPAAATWATIGTSISTNCASPSRAAGRRATAASWGRVAWRAPTKPLRR